MSQPIQVAFCGAGGIVRGLHLPTCEARPDRFQVRGFYDIALARSQELAGDRYRAYQTYADLLADADVQLVVVATKPLTTHFPAAKAALEAGKHVLLEKPMAQSSEECDQLIDLATANNRLLTVHHNRRLDLDFQALRHLLASGKLGEPKLIVSSIGSGGFTGGDFEDWGIHLIDQMLIVNPSPLVEVSAFLANPAGGRQDGGFCEATLRFESGPVTRISMLPRPQHFLANGTNAPDRFYAVGTGGAFGQRTIEVPQDLMNATQNFVGIKPDYAVPDYLTISRRDYYDYLYDSITDGAPLLVEPVDARNAIRTLELITESARQQKTIAATNLREGASIS